MYRYYRRKVGPKVNVLPIILTLITAISIFQVQTAREMGRGKERDDRYDKKRERDGTRELGLTDRERKEVI